MELGRWYPSVEILQRVLSKGVLEHTFVIVLEILILFMVQNVSESLDAVSILKHPCIDPIAVHCEL